MTTEQYRLIENSIYDAIEALPDGDDRERAEWVREHRFPSWPAAVKEALAEECLHWAIVHYSPTTPFGRRL